MTALAAAIMALIAQVASPSPEIEAQSIARLATAMGACDRVGYVVIPAAAEQAAQEFTDRTGQRGVELVDDGFAVERNQMARALDLSPDLPSAESRQVGRRARDFVYGRCAEAKAAYPSAFGSSDAEGKHFMGWIGLWLDNPWIEDAEFYMTGLGSCATFSPAIDARDRARRIVSPLLNTVPAVATDALQDHLVAAYRDGLSMGTDFDATQCRRLTSSINRTIMATPAGPFM